MIINDINIFCEIEFVLCILLYSTAYIQKNLTNTLQNPVQHPGHRPGKRASQYIYLPILRHYDFEAM